MKLAVIGSRTITIESLSEYLPDDVTEIVSGGAKGIDTCAAAYAEEKGITQRCEYREGLWKPHSSLSAQSDMSVL